MTPAAIALAIVQYGPAVLPLLQQLAEWTKSGKAEVSADDLKQLIDYSKKTSGDYLKEAGISKP